MDFKSCTPSEKENYIIAYLNGKLSRQESIEFQQMLIQDKDLRAQTRKIQNLIKVLQQPELVAVESQLLDFRAANIAAIYNNMNPVQRWWHKLKMAGNKSVLMITLISAVILLCLISAVAFSTDTGSFWSERSPYPVNFPQNESREQVVQEALTAYEQAETQEDWEDAAFKFGLLAGRGNTYKFYHVVATLFSQPEENAANLDLLNDFESTLDTEQKPYELQLWYWAQYYKALILFRENRHKEGTEIINELYEKDDIQSDFRDAIDNIHDKLKRTLIRF